MAVRDAAALLVGLLFLFRTLRTCAAVQVDMEDDVQVYQGEDAQISCSYTSDDGSGGMTMEWFYELHSTRAQEKRERMFYKDSFETLIEKGTRFTDRISVSPNANTLVLTIRDVQVEDEANYICVVKSLTDGRAENRTKLKVFVKPKHPTIELVENGISVNEEDPQKIGSCGVKDGHPKPNITWYKDNLPLRNIPDEVVVSYTVTTESSGLFSVVSELKKKLVKEDKDSFFHCEVTYFVPGGTNMMESTAVQATVYYPGTAVEIWVESPRGKIKEGDTVEFHCSENGNNPSSVFTIKNLKNNTSVEAKIMQLKNVSRQNSGVYECTSTDLYTFEELTNTTEMFVNYLDPAVVRPENIVVAKENEFEATCNALSSLPTQAIWFKNEEIVHEGHTLNLKNATFDTAGSYVCVVTVPEIEGMTTSSSLKVHVKGRPEIMETTLTDIETFDKTVELICDVRGYPTPTIIWTSAEGNVLSSVVRATDYGSRSLMMVDVAPNVTVFCTASNELGMDLMVFTIKGKTLAYTTTPAITSTTSVRVKAGTSRPPQIEKKESKGVIIAVIIICILLLAILGSVLYFLYKKGKICGRAGKQDISKEKSGKDNIVVEMKSDNTEEAILLGVNGEKQMLNDQ